MVMMIVIMMIIMTQVLPSRCTCCLGSRLPREAARPTDQIGRTSVRHLLATAVKPGIYGLAFTMGKWFLTDNSATVGWILMISSADPHEILILIKALLGEHLSLKITLDHTYNPIFWA